MEMHYITTPLMLIVLFSGIYKVGLLFKPNLSENTNDTEDFLFYDYDGKGKLFGKTVFSFFFALVMLFPLSYLDSDIWLKTILGTFYIISFFELYNTIKENNTKAKSFSFYGMIYIIFLGLIFFPIILNMNSNIILTIVLISIFTDLLSNFFGKQLAKLPEEYQFYRMKYPASISKNKSLTAVILSYLILVEITGLLGENIAFTTIVVIGAAVGDIFFSVYKRDFGIDDFFPTLGPIGGLLDRIDGWIFALIFGGCYSVFLM
jgi:CDP-diglyceride synthetase